MKNKRKECIKKLKRAESLLVKAHNATAEADAYISTYWKSELCPWILSHDLRTSANLSASLAGTIRILLESDIDSLEI